MDNKIKKIYIDFFNYYEAIKEKFNNVLEKCGSVDILFEDIINNIYTYYEQSEFYKNNAEIVIYFEIEEFITSIIKKIKKLIEYVNYIYYDILSCNDELFTSYIGIMYYISILDDFTMYLENKNIDCDNYKHEIEELNSMIYNKIELSDGFNQYIFNKINDIFKDYDDFSPSILIFKIVKTSLEESDKAPNEDFIQNLFNDFINNMESYNDLTSQVKEKDLLLYNKILKLENVILNLKEALCNIKLFDEKDEDIKEAFLIAFIDLYDNWMLELHRVYDLYGIEHVIKFKKIIYIAAIIRDIINNYGDIENENEQLGDYFISYYESILENNLDDVDQFVDYGKDLLDDLCTKHDLITNKLEEQLEFIYTLFHNEQIK